MEKIGIFLTLAIGQGEQRPVAPWVGSRLILLSWYLLQGKRNGEAGKMSVLSFTPPPSSLCVCTQRGG